jgi:hypothetical protein
MLAGSVRSIRLDSDNARRDSDAALTAGGAPITNSIVDTEARGSAGIASGLERHSRLVAFCAVAVAAVSAAVRLPGVVRDAFWQDEVASARIISTAGPLGMVRHVVHSEGAPPLWYGLGWLAHSLGLSVESFRALSVLAGAVLAGLVVILGRRILPLWASVAAGLLAAFGWQLVMHGRELRAYELFALLSVVFALLLLEYRSPPRSRRFDLAFAVCVAAGSLTNYFFLLTLAAALLWIWTEPVLKTVRLHLTRLVAAGLVPLVLWSPFLAIQYSHQRFAWIGPFDIRQVLNGYWLLFADRLPKTAGAREILPALALVAVIAGSIVLARSSPAARLVAMLATVPFALACLAWLAGARVYTPRNLIAVAPFAALAVAALLARLPRLLAYAAAIGLVSLVALGSIRAEAKPTTPYDRVARLLVAQGWRSSDPIELFGDFYTFAEPLDWYLPGQPTLALAKPARHGRCRNVFVVAQRPGNRAAIVASKRLAARENAGSVLVGRLRSSRIARDGFWRHAHIVATSSGSPACVILGNGRR